MSVSVNPPKTPITKGSSGIAIATLPNICKMPGPPAPFVPVPLPNIGKSGDKPKGYSKKVKVKKKTVAIKGASFGSMGDMASKGTGGGLISANTHGPCKFISPGSMDVKFEGKNVQLLTDMMTNNNGPSGSPPNAATMMGAIQASGVVYVVRKDNCPICGKNHDKDIKESPQTQASAEGLVNSYKETGAWAKAMIGVVHCDNKGHKHAGRTGPANPKFVEIAEGYHVFPRDRNKAKATVKMMGNAIGNPPAFTAAVNMARLERDVQRLNRKFNPDSDAAIHSRNPPGACAAQQALVWALEHNCTPSAMTEKWFSPGKAKRKEVTDEGTKYYKRKPPEKTKPVRHINMKGKLESREFSHGESVPPCETCNLLLPFLTCTEPKKNPCEKKPDGCSNC